MTGAQALISPVRLLDLGDNGGKASSGNANERTALEHVAIALAANQMQFSKKKTATRSTTVLSPFTAVADKLNLLAGTLVNVSSQLSLAQWFKLIPVVLSLKALTPMLQPLALASLHRAFATMRALVLRLALHTRR